MRYVLLALLGMFASVIGGSNGASGTPGGYPDSMASLGDSITRATNPGPGLFGDQPQYSWSTGSDITVESHYYRILQQNSLITGNNYNFAISGAKMADLSGQAANAVSQGVDYVTILHGGKRRLHVRRGDDDAGRVVPHSVSGGDEHLGSGPSER